MPWWAQKSVTFLLLVSILFGCARSPELPRLSTHSERHIDRILLDNELEADDIREILQALNEDQSLNKVIEHFDALSDETLNNLAELVDRWIREDGRFVGLLKQRFERKTFTELSQWLKEERKISDASARRDLLFSLLRDERSGAFFQRSYRFLNPSIRSAWDRVTAKAASVYTATGAKVSAISVGEGIWSVVSKPEFSAKTEALLSELLRQGAPGSFYRGMKSFSQSGGTMAFEGLRLGLKRMLFTDPLASQKATQKSNQLDLLFYFAEVASQPSKDYFKTLEEGLKSFAINIGGTTENTLQQLVSRTFAERIRLSKELSKERFLNLLEKPENEAVRDIYTSVLDAWKPLVGITDPSQSSSFRLAVHLNAFVVSRWLFTQLKENEAKVTALSEEGFTEKLWKLEIVPKTVAVEFAKVKDTGFTFPEKESLIGEDLTEIEQLVEAYVLGKVEPPSWFFYQLPLGPQSMTLSTALNNAMTRIDRRRKILGGEAVARLLLQYLTEPTLLGGQSLGAIKSDNLLDLLNRFLLVMELDGFRSLKRFLFEDLEIGTLEGDNKELVLELFASNETCRVQTDHLLESVQSIFEFDRAGKDDVPTPFEAYRAVVNETPVPHLKWISDSFSFLSQIEIASLDKVTKKPRFAFFFEGVQEAGFSKWLYEISLLSSPEWAQFEEALSGFAGGDNGFEPLHLLLPQIVANKAGWVSWFRVLEALPLPNSVTTLSPREYRWLTDFFDERDHDLLVQFFSASSRERWREMVKELRLLHDDGSLRRILLLFQLINDGPLKDFAKVMSQSEASGELASLLDAAASLLSEN